MDSIKALSAFVLVVDQGSFAGAAKHLGISSSAVGKTISRLEAQVGATLFTRTTRSIVLTEDGSRFLERCRRILHEIDSAEHELHQTSSEPVGRLRVSLPLHDEPFLPLVARFQKHYRSIQIDALATDRVVDLVNEGYDIAIRSGPNADSRLIAKRLGSFRLQMVASPSYVRENGLPQTLDELPRHHRVAFRFPDSGRIQPWKLGEDAAALTDYFPPGTILCSSLEGRLRYALEGVGIAYLPDFCVRKFIESGDLLAVLDSHANYRNVFHAIWASNKYTPPKLRLFLDFISQQVRLDA